MKQNTLIPERWKRKIRPVAKAVMAVGTTALLVVAMVAPEYNETAQYIVGAVGVVLVGFGVYRIPNRAP